MDRIYWCSHGNTHRENRHIQLEFIGLTIHLNSYHNMTAEQWTKQGVLEDRGRCEELGLTHSPSENPWDELKEAMSQALPNISVWSHKCFSGRKVKASYKHTPKPALIAAKEREMGDSFSMNNLQ